MADSELHNNNRDARPPFSVHSFLRSGGQCLLGRDFWRLVSFDFWVSKGRSKAEHSRWQIAIPILVPGGFAYTFFAFGFLRAKATLSLGALSFVRSSVFWGLNSLAILSGNPLWQYSLVILSGDTFLVWFLGARAFDFLGAQIILFSRGSRFVRILFLGALVTLLCFQTTKELGSDTWFLHGLDLS